MKKMTLPKVAFAALAVAGMMTFTAAKSDAVQETFQAAVEILAPLTITENTQLDFGQIVKPTSGENTFALDPDTGAITPGGGGDGTHVTGAGTPGDLLISAGASGLGVDVVNVTTFPGACTITDVSLEAVTLSAPSGITNFNVGVGGTVKVLSTAVVAAGTCAYTIQALFN